MQWARDFVGRLMADPAFVQKMVLESTIAACASLWYEYRARGERFKDELDLVLINTMGMAAATGATVWMVAPTRSYGSVHKFPWQQVRSSGTVKCELPCCMDARHLHLLLPSGTCAGVRHQPDAKVGAAQRGSTCTTLLVLGRGTCCSTTHDLGIRMGCAAMPCCAL